MRLYSFVAGSYLSQLQRGLQTAHVVGELHAKCDAPGFPELGPHLEVLQEWERHHKTIYILDAFSSGEVRRIAQALEKLTDPSVADPSMRLPTAMFREDAESLDGAATAVGVVVPARFYEAEFEAARLSNGKHCFRYSPEGLASTSFNQGTPQFDLIELLKKYPRAQS